MSKVSKIETAVRYLLVCGILSAPLLPAQAQGATAQAAAPLFSQPNYEGDLRQHSFFAGNYRDPIQTGVGYNEQALQYWKNPILQQPYNGAPTPISTGLIGDNIDTTIQSSVPGLVSAAVSGAVVGASVAGAAASSVAAGGSAAASSASTAAAGTSSSVNGAVLDNF